MFVREFEGFSTAGNKRIRWFFDTDRTLEPENRSPAEYDVINVAVVDVGKVQRRGASPIVSDLAAQADIGEDLKVRPSPQIGGELVGGGAGVGRSEAAPSHSARKVGRHRK